MGTRHWSNGQLDLALVKRALATSVGRAQPDRLIIEPDVGGGGGAWYANGFCAYRIYDATMQLQLTAFFTAKSGCRVITDGAPTATRLASLHYPVDATEANLLPWSSWTHDGRIHGGSTVRVFTRPDGQLVAFNDAFVRPMQELGWLLYLASNRHPLLAVAGEQVMALAMPMVWDHDSLSPLPGVVVPSAVPSEAAPVHAVHAGHNA